MVRQYKKKNLALLELKEKNGEIVEIFYSKGNAESASESWKAKLSRENGFVPEMEINRVDLEITSEEGDEVEESKLIKSLEKALKRQQEELGRTVRRVTMEVSKDGEVRMSMIFKDSLKGASFTSAIARDFV